VAWCRRRAQPTPVVVAVAPAEGTNHRPCSIPPPEGSRFEWRSSGWHGAPS